MSDLIFARDTRSHPGEGPINPYHYVPTLWICALFVALFGLSTLIHFGQAFRFRMWWLIPTACIAGITEVIGWSGRLWSSKNPTNITPFMIQITTTIIAPTPLIAANFIILGKLISRLGPKYSRISGVWYLVIFTSCDIIALIIQALGGAKASVAVDNDEDPSTGGNIMLAGIAFQLAAISLYIILASEFVFRFAYNKPVRKKPKPGSNGTHYCDTRTKLMIFGLGFSAIALFIRSVYRTIELADGWGGRIITTQVYFNVLDGGMIVLAMYTLNISHPGFLLIDTPETRRSDDTSDLGLKETKGVAPSPSSSS
ncbi:hypothetical protein NLI96_g7048 [Meripilus lineatus]|uniref:RTA1-domain-containing protein n=1 Tax=Meripilus lineatus TaxID=2056292 RepID=A0AAD5V255_9APHY|nr:hypothetical protein NLI96_g7048 [Physisporinus lineatus]